MNEKDLFFKGFDALPYPDDKELSVACNQSKDRTPVERKNISIEQFYSKENDIVYFNFRLSPNSKWHREETAFKDVPYVVIWSSGTC